MEIPGRRIWLLVTVALLAVGAVTISAMVLHGDLDEGPAFQDDFDGTELSGQWAHCFYWREEHCTNEWSQEKASYTAANLRVVDGQLRLTALRQDTPVYLMDGTRHTYEFSSGMVSSEGRFSFTYGCVEIRAKLPKGRGLWPALWLMAADRRWPPEVDIMEYIGSEPDRVHMSLHPDDGGSPKSVTFVGPDFSEDWHTFALDWQRDSLTFLVDGTERVRITGNNVPSEPMYLLVNLAVGGNWAGPPSDETSFPATFAIDYVKVWKGDPARCSAGAPGEGS